MKKIYILIVLGVLFLSINFVYSAPAPWGIALNHETKQCAGYWMGDEFWQYELPSGWKAYYPNYTRYQETGKLIIETEIGECNFWRGNESECCNQLGYGFVKRNIGKGSVTPFYFRYLIFSRYGILIILFVIVVLFFVVRYLLKKFKKKKK